MTRKREYDSVDDALVRLEEAQRHQYDPGYFVGRGYHPLYSRRRMPRFLGWVLVGGSLCYLLGVLLSFLSDPKWADLPVLLLSIGLITLWLFAGLSVVRKRISKPTKKQLRR